MATVITNSTVTVDGNTFLTADSDTIVLDNVNNRVGIGGVPSPSVPLQVNGNINATNNTNSVLISGNDGSIEIQRTGSPYIDFKTSAGEDHDVRLQQTDNGFTISTGGDGAATERMRIASDGNVGINTTSPSTELDVNGTIQDSQGNVRALDITVVTNTPYVVASGSSGKYFALTGGSSVVTINNSNFAIGDIITFYNRLATTATINFSGTSYVHIVGNGTAVTSVTLAAYGLCTLIYDRAGVIIINGNVS